MAPKRVSKWPNVQLQELHTDLKALEAAMDAASRSDVRAGRRSRSNGLSVEEAMDNVQESLDRIEEHPYNQVLSNPDRNTRLPPGGPGSARRLHAELKKLRDAPGSASEAQKAIVKKRLMEYVAVLDPDHSALKTTKQGPTEQEA